MPLKQHLLLACIAFTTLLSSKSTFAQDYVIDMVIFESLARESVAHYTDSLYYPVSRNAVILGSENAVNAGFIQQKPSAKSDTMISKLNASGRYKVLSQISWQQPGLSSEEARPIRITLGDELQLYLPKDAVGERGLIRALTPGTSAIMSDVEEVATHRLAGTVTISLGKYLHINTNLILIREDGTGSTRMQLHRRMRSKELHYLDNPRFGIVLEITPIEEPARLEE